MKRPILPIILALAGLLNSHSARAQFAVYGEYSATHDGAVSHWYNGGTFGVYDDFLHGGPIHLGGDIRATFASGSQYHYRDFLIGPRLAVKPPVLPFKPYIQAEVGFGGSHYVGSSSLQTHYSNKLQYGVIGGLDYTIFPYVDLRVPEISYMRMSAVSSIANAPKVNVVGLGFGLVVRIP